MEGSHQTPITLDHFLLPRVPVLSPSSLTETWSAKSLSHYLPKGVPESFFFFKICFAASVVAAPLKQKYPAYQPPPPDQLLSPMPWRTKCHKRMIKAQPGKAKENRYATKCKPTDCATEIYHFTSSCNILQFSTDQICSNGSAMSSPSPGLDSLFESSFEGFVASVSF